MKRRRSEPDAGPAPSRQDAAAALRALRRDTERRNRYRSSHTNSGFNTPYNSVAEPGAGPGGTF